EDSIMPRLYREAPVNAIWEGSGNVQCLDMLRAMARTPGSVEALISELEEVRGQHAQLDQQVKDLKHELADKQDIEYRARSVVEKMALALQASVLLRGDSNLVAEAFCRARFQPASHQMFGTIPRGTDCRA